MIILPDQFNTAVVGCGYWGRNLVRNFAELGALSAVCDADAIIAKRLADTYGARSLDWESVLADPAIRAVAIAAPAELHFRLASEALRRGKDVYVEKPLATRVPDAEEILRLAKENGRVLMVGHLLQYHPAFRSLKELVQGGVLGRLRYIYSNRLNLGKIRREENILWSFAPHDISMILSLAGEQPQSITASGANYLHDRIADVTTTHLAFANGIRAHVFVSWLHPVKEQKLVVVGDEGMAVFDDGRPWPEKLQLFRHRIEWQSGVPAPAKSHAEPVVVPEDEPLRLECQHFIDCVANRDRPITDGEEGLRVLQVLAAAQESLDRPEAQSADPPARPAFPGVTIHESAYVDLPCEIGEGSRIWHFSHVLKGVRIGRHVNIGQNVVIGPDVSVGSNCKIQNNVSLYKGVELEDGVFCGPSCVFTNVNNPRAEIERKSEYRRTLVRRGASIGANATIVCGHTLGRYCFVAAGAVVAGDVPDFALVAGVPARRMGWMSRAGARLGPDLICPIDGSRYRETSPDQLEEIV